jgi:cyclopropane fatty-acyl-phospholipid synthase-like methyltransferase
MENVWEEIYKKGDFLALEPHPEIGTIAALFKREKVKRILDLGCGAGRHVVYFAERGYDVYGLDLSPTALEYTIKSLSEKGLTAHVTLHDMVTLPYDDAYFDAVISVRVIHHNRIKDVRKTVQEISRVLRRKLSLVPSCHWTVVKVDCYIIISKKRNLYQHLKDFMLLIFILMGKLISH